MKEILLNIVSHVCIQLRDRRIARACGGRLSLHLRHGNLCTGELHIRSIRQHDVGPWWVSILVCTFLDYIDACCLLAFSVCLVIYIRYSQIKECTIAFGLLNSSIQKLNRVSLILGLLSTLGLSLVANFQETSVIVVHFIGAFMCFGCGTLYFWAQVIPCLYQYANIVFEKSGIYFPSGHLLVLLVSAGMLAAAGARETRNVNIQHNLLLRYSRLWNFGSSSVQR